MSGSRQNFIVKATFVNADGVIIITWHAKEKTCLLVVVQVRSQCVTFVAFTTSSAHKQNKDMDTLAPGSLGYLTDY